MSLLDLRDKIKYKYKSPSDDTAKDFMIPCLKESVRYDRAVGFFRGSSFRLFLDGLTDFLKKPSSKIRIITSPYLTEKDVEEIKRGLRDQGEVIESEMLAEIERLSKGEDKVILATLSWLISHNKLEIRIADMKAKSNALFHEKLGILTDDSGNRVTFYGSQNETIAAYMDNYDAIRVLTSWGDEENHTREEINDFEKLWGGLDPTVNTFPISDAIKNEIFKYSPKKDEELFRLLKKFQLTLDQEKTRDICHFNPRNLSPWTFQQRCIDSVQENKFKGILKMATGTGKTVTAFFCIEKYLKTVKAEGNRIIVLVPSSELADQWEIFLKSNVGKDNLVFKFNSKVSDSRKSDLKFMWDKNDAHNIFAIVNIQSLAKFYSAKRHLDFLIGDEVHTYGTINYMNLLNSIKKPKYLLGLSATPERYYDVEGTSGIFEYFGDIIFTFDIAEAQREPKRPGLEPVLSNYLYHLKCIDLNEEEQVKLDKVNRLLGQAFSSREEIATYDTASGSKLKTLVQRRSKIFKTAENKLRALEEILKENDKRLKNCIVYCEDRSQLKRVKEVFDNIGIKSYVDYHHMIPNRDDALQIFRDKHAKYILSMHCLDEGVDIPDCSSLILMSSSGNPREYIQRRGRVLRNLSRKGIVRIFDILVLPHEKNEKYRGAVMSQFLRVWEFIARSLSPEARGYITKYLSAFNITTVDLEQEVSKW